MLKYVDKNGRCNLPGRVTRSGTDQRRPKQRGQLPLPTHLQCHPKALTRTSLNPNCATFRPGAADLLVMSQAEHLPALRTKGRFMLQAKEGHIYGYHTDAGFALAWKRAAYLRGMRVDCVDLGETR